MPKASAAYIEFLGNHSVFTTNLLGYLQPMEHTLGVLWLFLFPAERSLVVILTWVSRCLAAVSFIYLSLRCSRKVWVCFSFAVILVLLVSPHVMLYEWTLLLIPAILHWENNAERRPFLVKYYLLMQIAAVVSISSTEWQQKLFSRSLNLGMVALIFISVGLYRQTLKDLAQS
jgi:hypothetical protein